MAGARAGADAEGECFQTAGDQRFASYREVSGHMKQDPEKGRSREAQMIGSLQISGGHVALLPAILHGAAASGRVGDRGPAHLKLVLAQAA